MPSCHQDGMVATQGATESRHASPNSTVPSNEASIGDTSELDSTTFNTLNDDSGSYVEEERRYTGDYKDFVLFALDEHYDLAELGTDNFFVDADAATQAYHDSTPHDATTNTHIGGRKVSIPPCEESLFSRKSLYYDSVPLTNQMLSGSEDFTGLRPSSSPASRSPTSTLLEDWEDIPHRHEELAYQLEQPPHSAPRCFQFSRARQQGPRSRITASS